MSNGARRNDPPTSHWGDQDVEPRRFPQKMRLLEQYAKFRNGLTNFEAGHHANIPPTSSYWKRCSELLDEGYIAVVKDWNDEIVTRENPVTHSEQRVCKITPWGLSEWRNFAKEEMHK